MYNYIYRKNRLQFIVLALLAAFAIVRLILAPPVIIGANGTVFPPQPIYDFLTAHPIYFRIAFGLIVTVQILLFQHFISRHNFLDDGSLMPAIWFLFLSLITIEFPTMSQAFLTNMFMLVLLLLNVNSLNSSNIDNANKMFWSGFTVAMAMLIEPSAILMCILIIVSLILGKTNVIKRLCLASVGLLLPFIYIASVCYITGKTYIITDFLPRMNFFSMLDIDINSTLFIIFCITLLLSLLYIIPAMKIHYDNKIVLLRKKYVIINTMLLISVLIALIGGHSFREALPYLILPIATYFSMMSQLKRNRIITDIVITAFCAIIIIINFTKML